MAIVRGKPTLGHRVFDISNLVFLTLLSLTFLYPFWTVILQSFSSPAETYKLGLKAWNEEWRLESWQYALSDPQIARAYFNTIFRVVFGTLGTLLVTFSGAYALSKRDLPGRSFITGVYLMTIFFSGGLVPLYLVVRSLGLINTRLVLILLPAIQVINIVIARNFLMTIDQAMEDSAVMDGAGYWMVLFRIIVPLSKPVIAVIALWSAVGHWNSWFDSLIYTPKREFRVLQLMIRDIIANQNIGDQLAEFLEDLQDTGLLQIPPESVVAATILITIGPIILFYPFIQKHFVKGVMLGSLKG